MKARPLSSPGVSTGIGLASAVRPAAEGAHVFVTGRRKTELDAAVEVIGPAATAVTGDISNLADLDRLYETIGNRGQGLDVLSANASAATLVPLEQVTEDDFDTLFGINGFWSCSGARSGSAIVGRHMPAVPPPR
ncbi:NAD(P)-dependent dehydrogenase (short-subunit alcohol dehydrogenase family) [Streptomyces canus]|uniref:NAD(P)-dependent dehydrogenase (Short-subunit alcohol dehydrogenase family) n=1 Tax=Streptomyces canus TaxID=58343 RepID=A0AAW8F6G1_9ACTN|nr:NAD(P)-dependent dehydrogenase (short-subunit alcohol dehydrogenase family) [Streptomyces canus]